jgi:hypothetical protein
MSMLHRGATELALWISIEIHQLAQISHAKDVELVTVESSQGVKD